MEDSKNNVVVTGFGPFGEHDVNVSWLAVKRLKEIGLGDGINLVIEELPVIYKDVSRRIPELWRSHQPKLVVHVGVSKNEKCICLEQCAHNDNYVRPDVLEKTPERSCCVDGAPLECKSNLDMEEACSAVNNSNSGVEARVSHDPGRYLCDFSYYCSLNMDKARSAFIHVPPEDTPYSVDQLANGIKLAINDMIRQLGSTS